MSRRAAAILAGAIGAIVIANVAILAIWLPRRGGAPPPNAERAVGTSASSAQPASPPASHAPASAQPTGGGFTVERQVTSASGNVRIKYARDRKTKMRRIIIEDAHRPDPGTVLYESKNNAWVLVSPDDQWIAMDERTGSDGGGARLYRRSSGSSLRYDPAGDAPAGASDLQDAVWKVYLSSTNSDANTPRRGVTIDATGWEKDSRKVNIAVAFLPTSDKPDVIEPWSCTYDVSSKQIEPNPDQPVSGPEVAATGQGDQGAFANVGEMNNEQAASDEEGDDDDALPGERFPATREDEMTEAEVNQSSLEDINYAINEMYARHGAQFKDPAVTKQFTAFPWYEPRPNVSYDQIEKEFSDLEKANLKVLNHCRESKQAAGPKKSRSARGNAPREEPKGEQIMRGLRDAFPGN